MWGKNPWALVVLACFVLVFSGFILYVTRTGTGDISATAVALIGPLDTLVVGFFFHQQATGQGASISAASATSALAASTGQPTSISAINLQSKTGAAATDTGEQTTESGVSTNG